MIMISARFMVRISGSSRIRVRFRVISLRVSIMG